MPQGTIVKGIGGFYYVRSGDTVFECRARGKFRRENISPLVGDNVEILCQNGSCTIENIMQRKTRLLRPPVANVEQAVIVFAACQPDPNLNLLDRMLLLAEYNHLKIVICINKIDLSDSKTIEELTAPYICAGYRVICTSKITGDGLDSLKSELTGKMSVFAGPSGVGKSTLLNSVNPGFSLKTGSISDKIGRGKHTTRQVELLQMEGGGYVVDSPGFSSLDIDFIDLDELQNMFPEFGRFVNLCRFTGCHHINEPGCAVKNAVSKGLINKKRYDSYIWFYNEIDKLGRKYK